MKLKLNKQELRTIISLCENLPDQMLLDRLEEDIFGEGSRVMMAIHDLRHKCEDALQISDWDKADR
jgi:ABC-type cobalamin transport system ATPase subunit